MAAEIKAKLVLETSGGGLGGTMGSGSSTGAASIAGKGMIGKIAAGVATGSAILGVVKGLMSKILESSGRLQNTLRVGNNALKLILKPIGDIISIFLKPMAIALLKFAIKFNKWFDEDKKNKVVGGIKGLDAISNPGALAGDLLGEKLRSWIDENWPEEGLWNFIKNKVVSWINQDWSEEGFGTWIKNKVKSWIEKGWEMGKTLYNMIVDPIVKFLTGGWAMSFGSMVIDAVKGWFSGKKSNSSSGGSRSLSFAGQPSISKAVSSSKDEGLVLCIARAEVVRHLVLQLMQRFKNLSVIHIL